MDDGEFAAVVFIHHSDVIDLSGPGFPKKNKVARLGLFAADFFAEVFLRIGRAGKGDVIFLHDVGGEARTIEASGRFAAPAVSGPHVLLCIRNDFSTEP